MILIDEMIPMRLYSSKIKAFLPFNPSNKKKGSLVTLLTRNLEDSMSLINNPTFYNPAYYISYYQDRNVKRYLSSDGNIQIEGEDTDPDEIPTELQEAVIHKNIKNSPKIVCYGNGNDLRQMEKYFVKKTFDKWYDYFRARQTSRLYPTVYGFNTRDDMFKAAGATAIEKHSHAITNSYNSSTEIVVLNNSQYSITEVDGPYWMYCESAIITYVIHTTFKNCSWELANHMAVHLSGQDQYLYQKNNFNSNDTIGMAMLIGKYNGKYGRSGMIELARSGNYYKLVQFGADAFVKRVADPIMKAVKNKSVVTESDGSHMDVVRVFKSMDEKDQKYIAVDRRFQSWSIYGDAIYCHIEKNGLMDVYGFIECYPDIDNSASVVIGVDPRHRGEGVATKMMERMLKEFPKENPKVTNLIWRADAKNKKSQNLAEKFGFKLIRSSSVQAVYRKWLKDEDKTFDYIPDDVLCEEDLVKWMRKKFELDTSYASDKTKVKSIKEIVSSKKITRFDAGMLINTAIKKMGLNRMVILFIEHNGSVDTVGDVYPMVIHTYGDWKECFVVNPFDKSIKSGIGLLKNIDLNFQYGEKLHSSCLWGDPETHKHIFSYVPYEEELVPGNNVYRDIVKIQNLTESSILEFTTRNKTTTIVNDKLPMSLSRLKKVPIDDKVIKTYSPYLSGLRHVRTTNNCTGYLWLDSNRKINNTSLSKPVCYYNTQRKNDDNSDTGYIVWLQGIEVSDEYQGRGLAKQMLNLAISQDKVTNLAVNKHNELAIQMYKNAGFKQYVANGEMIFMQLPIRHETVYISPNDPGVMMFEGQMFVFTEALSQQSYNSKLKKYLYAQRMRTTAQQMEIFNTVKENCPKIRKTYVRPQMYNNLNCFIDLSYYNGLFLRNNTTARDIAIQFYWEFLNRMLSGTDPYFRDNYGKNTIFIPVSPSAWDVKKDTYIYDWRENLNPISLIFRMIRKNPSALINGWKDYNFIFVGKTGYFRVDFSKFQLKNLTKFKINLEKLYRSENIEEDENASGYSSVDSSEVSSTSSSSAIAAMVIDKIETSSGIEINDISGAIRNNDQNIEDITGTDKTSYDDIPDMKICSTPIRIPDLVPGIGIMGTGIDNALEAIKNNRDLMPNAGIMYYYSK